MVRNGHTQLPLHGYGKEHLGKDGGPRLLRRLLALNILEVS